MSEETGGPVELLSRFADLDATDEVDLGPCQCPGAPHERDSATFRTQWGDGERKSIFYAGAQIRLSADGDLETAPGYDPEIANNELLARGVVSWTLTDREGEPVPITRRNLSALDEPTRLALLTALQNADKLFRSGALPNASGARSRGSPRASASRTRTPRRPR
jgi:hypothetical protein